MFIAQGRSTQKICRRSQSPAWFLPLLQFGGILSFTHFVPLSWGSPMCAPVSCYAFLLGVFLPVSLESCKRGVVSPPTTPKLPFRCPDSWTEEGNNHDGNNNNSHVQGLLLLSEHFCCRETCARRFDTEFDCSPRPRELRRERGSPPPPGLGPRAVTQRTWAWSRTATH